MRNRIGKGIRLAGVLCIMSLMVCACADGGKAGDSQEPQTEQSQPDTENTAAAPQTKVPGDTGKEEPDSGADGEEASEAWEEREADLEGDIADLEKGQLTVIELATEETEDGGAVLVGPASGSDGSDFSRVTVTYDGNTLFRIQTIYDGGARTEESKATAEDLEKEQLIMVWGSFSEGVWEASQICIVKVG